jgi:SH3 domain protein
MQSRIFKWTNVGVATSRARALTATAALLCLGALASPALSAEPAWVDNEVRLNLRTGAGTTFRIVGSVTSGDRVDILGRENNWTQIRLEDGKRGWIPAGYLKSEAPPDVRLAEAEDELHKLKSQFENATIDVSRLRESNDEISGREKERSDEINRLTLENLDLKSGPRWPEWITGASILSVGMVLGALLRGSSSRRPTPRIRL